MSRSMPRTKAALLLARWVEREGNSQATLARALEVSQPAVSAWLRGASRPETHLREAIALLTQVSADLWDTEAERALVERVRAHVEQGVAEPRRASVPPPRKATGRTRATKRAPQENAA